MQNEKEYSGSCQGDQVENAGPFELTFDIIFKDREYFELFKS